MLTSLPIVEELAASTRILDAVQAVSDWPGTLLFESALQRAPVGRFSFLMADPVASWKIDKPIFGSDPFVNIRPEWEAIRAETQAGLPPFQGGVAGLLGYELGQCWERAPSAACDEFQLPVMAVGLYDWVIAWDHAEGRVWLISQGWPETNSNRRRDQAAKRISSVKGKLARNRLTTRLPSNRSGTSSSHSMDRSVPDHNLTEQRSGQLVPRIPLVDFPQVSSSFSRAEYLKTVQRVIDYIDAGDIFQANLSQRLLAQAPCSPIELYARLRQVNPAPFAGLMLWDDWAIVSASPERFLCVTDGQVETRPIKGTRQRKRGPEADLFTRDELRQSEKDQAENVMIVDLLRNDLSRVCQPGSVRVPHLCTVESYETVQHLVSEVRGQLQPERTVWDLFKATFPGGSISGAPKVRAMQIIAELEPTVRGPYCGSLFYVGTDGTTDSNLLIRTFVQRDGWLQCNVGGGIVARSDPASEYDETLTKAVGMLKALVPLKETEH